MGGGEHPRSRLDAAADLLHIVDHPGIPVHIGHLLAEVADADGLPRLDRPGVGGQLPGQQVEEGRLARSVCPQNRENLSLLKGEAHVIKQGAFRPVGEGQMFYFQNHDSFILCFNRR